jgi:hypothetical protein
MRVCQASIPSKLHGFELRTAFRSAPSFSGLGCPAPTRCHVQAHREAKGSAAVPVTPSKLPISSGSLNGRLRTFDTNVGPILWNVATNDALGSWLGLHDQKRDATCERLEEMLS